MGLINTSLRWMVRSLPLVILLVILTASAALAQQWQWPEKPENLTVLPETTTTQELRNTMLEFVRALDVRCEHCHVGEAGQPLSTFDFASDDKEAKQSARVMMRMVQAINGEHLADLEKPAAERLTVTCTTCHRSHTRPQRLENALAEFYTMPAHDIQETIAHYRTLRETYYGGFTYDFQEPTLRTFAGQLLSEGKPDDAIAVFKLNLEFYPDSWLSYFSMGNAYASQQQKDLAIENIEKALEINPRAGFMQQRLNALKQEE